MKEKICWGCKFFTEKDNHDENTGEPWFEPICRIGHDLDEHHMPEECKDVQKPTENKYNK